MAFYKVKAYGASHSIFSGLSEVSHLQRPHEAPEQGLQHLRWLFYRDVVVKESFVRSIPARLDVKAAAPMLCAGAGVEL